MDDRFFHGVLGCEVSILGWKLQDLNPWHIIILNSINNPVLTEGGEVKPEDVAVFCRVLKTQWPEVPNLNPSLIDLIKVKKLNRKKRFFKEVLKIRDWLKVQTSSPRLWDLTYAKGASERKLTSPAMLALVLGVVSKAHIPLKVAWNMRLSELRWYDVTLAEINGSPLRVAYEGEEQPAAKLAKLSEADIIKIAKSELSEEDFKRWNEARKTKK